MRSLGAKKQRKAGLAVPMASDARRKKTAYALIALSGAALRRLGTQSDKVELTRYATWAQQDLEEFNEALAAQRTTEDPL